uniref:LRAT domain-containing protein n=1 Tax=Oreochromis niloticus TaxID=8128 RepID=A0A669CVG5_ORENI
LFVEKILLFFSVLQSVSGCKTILFYFQYTFGDIISFPRKCAKINKAYKHFAVYFLLIITGKPTDGKYCVFGSLKKEPKHAKENYLDKKFTPSNRTDIIEHIKVMKTEKNCGTYSLLKNNCEHLATWVRYGKAYVKQVCDNNIVLLCLLKVNNPPFNSDFSTFILFTAWNRGRVFSPTDSRNKIT